MENIKQLEKKILKKIKKKYWIDEELKEVIDLTLQEVCKEIEGFNVDKELKSFEGERTDFVKLGMELFKAKILKKFQGEEK